MRKEKEKHVMCTGHGEGQCATWEETCRSPFLHIHLWQVVSKQSGKKKGNGWIPFENIKSYWDLPMEKRVWNHHCESPQFLLPLPIELDF